MTRLAVSSVAPGGDGLHGKRRKLAVAGVLGAMVLVVLDAAVANVALPTIATSLAISASQSVKVITAYQLALVVGILPCAAFGDSFGYRRLFVAGIGVFVAASALCALAPSFALLVVARFIQGLGGSCVMALGVALLRLAVPAGRLGAAISWNALTVALTSASGPTVGAIVLCVASWRYLFAINLPLGVALLCLWRALPSEPGSSVPVDKLSMAVNMCAFAGLFLGLERITSHMVSGTIGVLFGLVMLFVLARRELTKSAPMLPFDLLRGISFRASVIASVCCFVGQALGLVALPFYLQRSLGLSIVATGIAMTPWPVAVALTAPIASRLAETRSTARLCTLGGGLLAVGLLGLALLPLHESAARLVPFVAVCGIGFGLFQTPNNRNMFLAVPRGRSGAAGGMQGTARLTGQTAGAVILSALLMHLPVDTASHLAFSLGALMALAAALASAWPAIAAHLFARSGASGVYAASDTPAASASK